MKPDRTSGGRSTRGKVLVVVAALAGVAVWLLASGAPSSGELRRTVHGAGWFAPVAFVALYAGWTVLLLPGVVPTLVGGALFGVTLGVGLVLLGALTGASAAFLIGRRLGHGPARTLVGRRAPGLEDWLVRRGFVALLYARLVPLVPFSLLNYAAGIAGLSTRSYLLGTAIGIVPGTVAYTALGSSAGQPGSVPFLVSLGAVALLSVGVAVVSRRSGRQRANR